MSNLPAWARVATSTPALRKRFGAAIRTDHFDVEAEDDNESFVGRVTKIGRNRYEWRVWASKQLDGVTPEEHVLMGRSRTLLKAISKVRLEYGLYHARLDAAREAAAKPKRAPRKKATTQAEAA